jgi:acetyltransferase-like isoleucine patch superfamily enzyme
VTARVTAPRRNLRREVLLRIASAVQGRVHGFGALGSGSLVRPPYTLVSPDRIFIGARTIIGPNSMLSVVTEHAGEIYDAELHIGDDTRVGQNFIVGCAGRIYIGRQVLISANVYIGDTIHRYDDPSRSVIEQPLMRDGVVRIDDGAFIGINAVILPGVRVGRNAVVGAGSVVTRDVPSHSVVAGNPARVIKRYDRVREEWVECPPELSALRALRVA